VSKASTPAHFSLPAVTQLVTTLAIILGDQLNLRSQNLKNLDKSTDAVLMMEVRAESEHVRSHKQRTVLFLSAMRHFALELADAGYRVHYVKLDHPANTQSFAGEIVRAVRDLQAQQLTCTHPGEWRVLDMLKQAAAESGVPLDLLSDEHFLTRLEEFEDWCDGRKQLVMEYFYRQQRRKLDILLDRGGKPVGGKWNFDDLNREALKTAPQVKKPYTPRPDAITHEVIRLVNEMLPDNPGRLESFRWPVTRRQALRALDDFIKHRLCDFGRFEDAMWSDEPFLYHSVLSPLLNLKLLDPRECIDKAIAAYNQGHAPLNSVEGFVRQIIGWREFIRGVYWQQGPEYGSRNELQQHGDLPAFYWSGETDMVCMHSCIGQVLDTAYGHHIQRLMVTGNFALIAGVEPRQVAEWYLAMYADAVDWVTLPNTLGMVMHADGGVVGTKPYAASGKYIQRMSNYCEQCLYDPAVRSGLAACPFTTLYWDFLIRNHKSLGKNRRMGMVLRHVDKMSKTQRQDITAHARSLRTGFGITHQGQESS
jgi:deoxyribodipyrimidine photolyase-related protein